MKITTILLYIMYEDFVYLVEYKILKYKTERNCCHINQVFYIDYAESISSKVEQRKFRFKNIILQICSS